MFGGVTLAATGGGLPLVGESHHPHPASPPARAHHPAIVLPRGAIAFSATGGGRAWLATSSGARRCAARPLSALAVSPGAINLLEGSGRVLVAVAASDGHIAFTRRVPGAPIAAAWAPAGIRIAYVVRTDERRPAVRHVRQRPPRASWSPARTDGGAPSWRWDSQAFAYVRADGTVDGAQRHRRGRRRRSRAGAGCAGRPTVAFAPFGGLLAIADRAGHVQVDDTLHPSHAPASRAAARACPSWRGCGPASSWSARAARSSAYVVGLAGGADVTSAPGQVAGLAAAPGGHRIAVALRDASGHVRVVEARTPRFSEASFPLRIYRVLADLGRIAGPVQVGWQ